MKKFIVYTRAIPGIRKGNDPPSVIEVEGELIKPTEDPSVMWLPPGEFKFRILKPEYLYEPKEIVKDDKTVEKIMIPPIYYSHSVYWTVSQALSKVEVLAKCKEIKEIPL